MFLGFANFYRKFIKNFGRITAPLISMLQIIDDKTLSIQATKNKKNQDVSASADNIGGDRVDKNMKNLCTIAKLAKSKKPKLTKPKKLDLIKAQNFVKANSSEMDFLTSEAKKTFIHL